MEWVKPYPEIKAGDLLFVSGKTPMGHLINLGTGRLPNVGPLGRWRVAGYSHVAIVASVFGDLIAFESTSFGRPPCVCTPRDNPVGVQAHYISTLLDSPGDVFHFPLRCPLYPDEEERLLQFLHVCLGREYDFWGAGKSGGRYILRAIQIMFGKEDMSDVFCSELVAKALSVVGVMQCKNASAWSPNRLARYVRRRGICGRPRLLT